MFSTLFQLFLLGWYFLSLYLVATDVTLSLQLKITGELINLLAIAFIATNLLSENTHNVIYYMTAILLFTWHVYFIFQDYNNSGYTPIEKYGYTAIDLIMILYIFSMLIFSIVNTLHCKINLIHTALKFKGFLFGV